VTQVNLLPGDVILVEGTHIWDRLVEWATVSPYSHAALVADGYLIEALENQGVVQSEISKYYCSSSVAMRTGATEDQIGLAIRWAEGWIGKRYGWREALTAGVRDVLHVPLRAKMLTHLDCSGLVAASYAAARYPLTRAIAPTPADLWASELLREAQ
jgi:cell wall-associated NlpC family hydrolase